ncbi:MAG: ribulose-phosphate 3-epimerase [Thermoplasmata archaeon]|nr:ribulose-phosphate 3-epimerase [Thermoplasmata archaeon]
MRREGILVSPSILSADFSRLGEDVRLCEASGADMIHVDVMDGHFVPNLTIGPVVVRSIRPHTSLPLDVHLMIEHPLQYLEEFVKAGANWITCHVEAGDDPGEFIRRARDLGVSPGISINPPTPPEALEPYLDEVDLVLVMTVNPGFSGQRFMEDVLPKISWVRERREALGRDFIIMVDGGVNRDTGRMAVEAGADALVAGSYLFRDRGEMAGRIAGLKASGGQDGR